MESLLILLSAIKIYKWKSEPNFSLKLLSVDSESTYWRRTQIFLLITHLPFYRYPFPDGASFVSIQQLKPGVFQNRGWDDQRVKLKHRCNHYIKSSRVESLEKFSEEKTNTFVYFLTFYFIGIQLVNSVMIVSLGQQRLSAIHIDVSNLHWTPPKSRLPHDIEQSSLCYTADLVGYPF